MPILLKRFALAGLSICLTLATCPAEAQSTAQLLLKSRDLVAAGSIDQAIGLLENGLESTPEADYAGVVDQLRKFYVVAINEARQSGRLEQAEQYSQNLHLMDSAASGGSSPSSASSSTLAIQSPPPAPAREPVAQAIPKASSRNDLHDISTARPETAAPPQAFASTPAPVAEKPADMLAAHRGQGSNVQQFDLAEADTSFRNKKYAEAGAIYQKLMDAGSLPATRNGHLAYCRSAALVERINRRPTSPQEWNEIQAELAAIQKLQPDFWFAEYLSDLVKERQNRSVAGVNQAGTTQLASNDGSAGVVSRAASGIRSLNPLRKPTVAR